MSIITALYPLMGTKPVSASSARFLAGRGFSEHPESGTEICLLSEEQTPLGGSLLLRDIPPMKVGDRLTSGDLWLMITRTGEETFARVLAGGTLSVGDELTLVPDSVPTPPRVAVITSSDKGSRGERADLSGPKIEELCREAGMLITRTLILPDERDQLAEAMKEMSDSHAADLILTTGGTGFAPRDCTPEATLDVVERQVPGIPAAMVANSLQYTPRAMLTRAVAGIRGKSLIINLPGSPKAVEENLRFILPALSHGVEMLRGEGGECARKDHNHHHH